MEIIATALGTLLCFAIAFIIGQHLDMRDGNRMIARLRQEHRQEQRELQTDLIRARREASALRCNAACAPSFVRDTVEIVLLHQQIQRLLRLAEMCVETLRKVRESHRAC